MEKIWLKQYPAGVPAEVKTDVYPSLVALVDESFRKYRDQLMIEGLTFRDTRATALTLLSRRVDLLTLQRVSGHLDLRQLTDYYRERAEDIAARI